MTDPIDAEALGQACAVILRYLTKQIASELALAAQPSVAAVPEALRMEDAAKLLGLSGREVQRLVLNGMLKSFKVGRIRLIPPSSIHSFVEARMTELHCVTDTQSELRQGPTGPDGSTMAQDE